MFCSRTYGVFFFSFLFYFSILVFDSCCSIWKAFYNLWLPTAVNLLTTPRREEEETTPCFHFQAMDSKVLGRDGVTTLTLLSLKRA